MIERGSLGDLAAFARVAELRSFRKAAVVLGVSPSALSHCLRGLETRLGVRLLNRTSRSVTPTEAGAALLARLGPAFGEIEAALGAVTAWGDSVRGTLRINAPLTACRLFLIPLVGRLLAAHPNVRVEVQSDNALTDIVGEGFDAGVRLGETLAKDVIAVPLSGPQRFVVAGAPSYFTARGVPQHPADLAAHNCIRQRLTGGGLLKWDFEREGVTVNIAVDGSVILNDQPMIVEAARAGHGLAFVFDHYVREAVAAGELLTILDDWSPPFAGFYLYYPGRRQLPPALRAFVDLVKRHGPATVGRRAPGG